MAYVEVPDEFILNLKGRLARDSKLLEEYLAARKKWYEYQDGYNKAYEEFQALRRQVADELLSLNGDIDRVEHHKKGEAW